MNEESGAAGFNSQRDQTYLRGLQLAILDTAASQPSRFGHIGPSHSLRHKRFDMLQGHRHGARSEPHIIEGPSSQVILPKTSSENVERRERASSLWNKVQRQQLVSLESPYQWAMSHITALELELRNKEEQLQNYRNQRTDLRIAALEKYVQFKEQALQDLQRAMRSKPPDKEQWTEKSRSDYYFCVEHAKIQLMQGGWDMDDQLKFYEYWQSKETVKTLERKFADLTAELDERGKSLTESEGYINTLQARVDLLSKSTKYPRLIAYGQQPMHILYQGVGLYTPIPSFFALLFFEIVKFEDEDVNITSGKALE